MNRHRDGMRRSRTGPSAAWRPRAMMGLGPPRRERLERIGLVRIAFFPREACGGVWTRSANSRPNSSNE